MNYTEPVMEVTEPVMEVMEFEKQDIICTSGLEGENQGDGNYGSINDWL